MNLIECANLALLALAYATLAIYVLLRVRGLGCRLRRLCAQFPGFHLWANVRFSGVFSKATNLDSDVFTKEVNRLVVFRRIEGIRIALRWFGHASAVYQVYRWSPFVAEVVSDRPFRIPFLVMLVSVLSVSMLVPLYPKVLTLASADAFLLWIMACYATMLLLWERSPEIVYDMPIVSVSRFVLSIGMSYVPVRVLANVGFTIVTCVVFVSIAADNGGTQQSHDVTNTPGIIMREVFAMLFILLVSTVINRTIMAEAHATVMSKVSRHSEIMANSLLSALCDAVFQLDDSLQICAAAPKLAAILLLQPQKDLTGTCFLDFVDEADRKQFEEVNGRSGVVNEADRPHTAEPEVARLMHIQLLDVHGARIKVELLLATCWNLDARARHIVGVREIGSEEGSQFNGGFLNRRLEHVASLAINDTGSSGSSVYTSDSDWEHSSVAASDDNRSAMSITIDAESARYTILHCFPADAFGSSISLVGACFLDILRTRDGERLKEAIQDLGHAILYDTSASGDECPPFQRMDLGKLTFVPRVANCLGIKYEASCVLQVALIEAATSEFDDEEPEFVVKVIMHGLRRLLRTRQGPNHERGSPSRIPSQELPSKAVLDQEIHATAASL